MLRQVKIAIEILLTVSSNEVAEPRACYTEWSNSEREKPISYMNAYMWTLEGWYWWSCSQSSSGEADIENRLMDKHGREEGGDEWVERAHGCIYTVLCLVAQPCPTLWDPMDCSPPGSSVHGDSPGKNTGVGCHFLLPGIFPTQGLNPGLPHCRQILYRLSHQGSTYTKICE